MALESNYVEGMKLLRSAATLQIIVYVLSFASSLLFLLSLLPLFTSLHFAPRNGFPSWPAVIEKLAPGLVLLALAAILLIVAAVLGFIAIFAKLIPSASRLANWRSRLSTPSKLVKYGYWGALAFGILALIIVGVALATLAPQITRGFVPGEGRLLAFLGWVLGGAALALIAAIMSFIGWIGLLILLFELSSETGIGGFKTAAVLHIAGVAASLLSVSVPLLFIAVIASTALELAAWYLTRDSAEKALQPPPPPPPTTLPTSP
ncbi:MAG: hypothetical protein QXS92_03280 [Thermofilum sp.]